MIHLAFGSNFLILCRDFCIEAGMQLIIHLRQDVVSLLVTERLNESMLNSGICRTSHANYC